MLQIKKVEPDENWSIGTSKGVPGGFVNRLEAAIRARANSPGKIREDVDQQGFALG
jgi:hypothetical protein